MSVLFGLVAVVGGVTGDNNVEGDVGDDGDGQFLTFLIAGISQKEDHFKGLSEKMDKVRKRKQALYLASDPV